MAPGPVTKAPRRVDKKPAPPAQAAELIVLITEIGKTVRTSVRTAGLVGAVYLFLSMTANPPIWVTLVTGLGSAVIVSTVPLLTFIRAWRKDIAARSGRTRELELQQCPSLSSSGLTSHGTLPND
jgi:hypothetical protein